MLYAPKAASICNIGTDDVLVKKAKVQQQQQQSSGPFPCFVSAQESPAWRLLGRASAAALAGCCACCSLFAAALTPLWHDCAAELPPMDAPASQRHRRGLHLQLFGLRLRRRSGRRLRR